MIASLLVMEISSTFLHACIAQKTIPIANIDRIA
jgi:hypothetical protein